LLVSANYIKFITLVVQPAQKNKVGVKNAVALNTAEANRVVHIRSSQKGVRAGNTQGLYIFQFKFYNAARGGKKPP